MLPINIVYKAISQQLQMSLTSVHPLEIWITTILHDTM